MSKIKVGDAVRAMQESLGPGWERAPVFLSLAIGATVVTRVLTTLHLAPTLVSNLAFPLLLQVVNGFALGALYRTALARPGDLESRGLGPIEWRASVVSGAVLVCNVVVLMIAGGLWGLLIGIFESSDQATMDNLRLFGAGDPVAGLRLVLGPAGVISAAVFIPVMTGLIYMTVRLSLLAITWIDTGGLALGRAWSLTRGLFWTIALAWVVMLLINMLAAFFGAMPGGLLGLLLRAVTGGGGGGRAWATITAAAAAQAVSLPLWAGLTLFIYKTRRGDVSEVFT